MALAHVVRIIKRWKVQIGPLSVSMAVSWVSLVVATLIAIWGFIVHRSLEQRMAMGVHVRCVCATAALVVFLAASLGIPTGFAAESKRVLLLHSFGRDFRPWSNMAKPFAQNWIANHRGRWTSLRIRWSRPLFSDENPEAPFVKYLRALFAKRPLDLIVSIGGG